MSRVVKCKMSRRVKSGKLDDVISLPERKHVKFNPQLCREQLIYSKLKPYFLLNLTLLSSLIYLHDMFATTSASNYDNTQDSLKSLV